ASGRYADAVRQELRMLGEDPVAVLGHLTALRAPLSVVRVARGGPAPIRAVPDAPVAAGAAEVVASLR
ncbi:MAG TPA: hypothetical protein VGX50_13595, partial [Longimicrobium sp.]|nr:hypothetical protein [Longimicrobium sp.]